MRSFDEWIRSEGTDPDPRFSLANERTFLSWITTSLGFLGAGLAIGTLVPESSLALDILSIIWIVMAALLALRALTRWYRVERAIRRQDAMPVSASIPVVAVAMALLSIGSVLALAVAR